VQVRLPKRRLAGPELGTHLAFSTAGITRILTADYTSQAHAHERMQLRQLAEFRPAGAAAAGRRHGRDAVLLPDTAALGGQVLYHQVALLEFDLAGSLVAVAVTASIGPTVTIGAL
jgi:hypothetical protein